jgi:hypothetical protein
VLLAESAEIVHPDVSFNQQSPQTREYTLDELISIVLHGVVTTINPQEGFIQQLILHWFRVIAPRLEISASA